MIEIQRRLKNQKENEDKDYQLALKMQENYNRESEQEEVSEALARMLDNDNCNAGSNSNSNRGHAMNDPIELLSQTQTQMTQTQMSQGGDMVLDWINLDEDIIKNMPKSMKKEYLLRKKIKEKPLTQRTQQACLGLSPSDNIIHSPPGFTLSPPTKEQHESDKKRKRGGKSAERKKRRGRNLEPEKSETGKDMFPQWSSSTRDLISRVVEPTNADLNHVMGLLFEAIKRGRLEHAIKLLRLVSVFGGTNWKEYVGPMFDKMDDLYFNLHGIRLQRVV